MIFCEAGRRGKNAVSVIGRSRLSGITTVRTMRFFRRSVGGRIRPYVPPARVAERQLPPAASAAEDVGEEASPCLTAPRYPPERIP